MYTNIIETIENEVLNIWLNRPSRKNALTPDIILEISDSLQKHGKKNKIRATILRGKGEVFSSGADLKWLKHSTLNELELLANLFYQIYTYPVPVIVVSHGLAFGGALGFITAGDIAVSTHDCFFSFSETKLGLIPALISPYVVERTGKSIAKNWMLTSKKISAKEAMEKALIHYIVQADSLEKELQNIIHDIRQTGPNASKACKKLINTMNIKEINPYETEYLLEELGKIKESEEANEGINSFFQKHPPLWTKNIK